MKISNIKTLSAIASAILLTACGENSWNDHLDGFTVPPVYTATETVNYTLTDADYKTISSLAANQALATTPEEEVALAAIGTNLRFADKEQARKYIPALFTQSSFPYFTMIPGSSIVVKYAIGNGVSEETDEINAGTPEYKLTQDEYKSVWGSDTEFINAFAPEKPASSFIPRILSDLFDDAAEGAYAVVNYNEAETNPIFGTVGGGDDKPEWNMSDVIGSLEEGSQADVRGVVTGISTRGFVVTDKSGSICYDSGVNGFNDDLLTIGSQVNVQGEVGTYSRCLQISKNNTYEIVGTQAYTYPTPEVFTGAMVEAACGETDNMLARYISLQCTVKISGSYINLEIPDSSNKGSAYYAPDFIKAYLTDGASVTLTGYFVAVTGGAKYFNVLVTGVNGENLAKPVMMKAPVVDVTTKTRNAIYQFDGSKWSVPANTIILQPEDYTSMGQTYGNLSGQLPYTILPKYLNMTQPFATEDQNMTVVYKYYDGSSTSYRASLFIFNGMEWTNGNNVTEQFSRNDEGWRFNPSVTITLPAGRGQSFSAVYYQACVDWVYENIDVPLGSTGIKSGMFYVTSYGNNEYYSGTSAYQNNLDLRGDKARAQYPAGYEVMTDAEIVELEKKRFCTEVFPGALSRIYPDAETVEGMDVLYTFTFSAYYGTETLVYTGVWKVSGKATFEFVECHLAADPKVKFYE